MAGVLKTAVVSGTCRSLRIAACQRCCSQTALSSASAVRPWCEVGIGRKAGPERIDPIYPEDRGLGQVRSRQDKRLWYWECGCLGGEMMGTRGPPRRSSAIYGGAHPPRVQSAVLPQFNGHLIHAQLSSAQARSRNQPMYSTCYVYVRASSCHGHIN